MKKKDKGVLFYQILIGLGIVAHAKSFIDLIHKLQNVKKYHFPLSLLHKHLLKNVLPTVYSMGIVVDALKAIP